MDDRGADRRADLIVETGTKWYQMAKAKVGGSSALRCACACMQARTCTQAHTRTHTHTLKPPPPSPSQVQCLARGITEIELKVGVGVAEVVPLARAVGVHNTARTALRLAPHTAGLTTCAAAPQVQEATNNDKWGPHGSAMQGESRRAACSCPQLLQQLAHAGCRQPVAKPALSATHTTYTASALQRLRALPRATTTCGSSWASSGTGSR